jgi:dTDP-4-dehydrorhamnose reductase
MAEPARADRRVLLTGASGLLGYWLLATRSAQTTVVALEHRNHVAADGAVQADLRDASATLAAVRKAKPSLIIHAAYAHDQASIVDGTTHVAHAADAVGADLVFISSDAVFGGDGEPRDESAVPHPVWEYGRWKLEAERIACQRSPATAIVRLPLLVSIEPDDHVVREVRDAANTGMASRWFVDETRQPAPASEVASAIWKITGLSVGLRSGIWHLPGAERLTRHEIARRVVDHLGLARDVVDGVVTPEDAIRPRDIYFTGERARSAIGWCPARVLS